MVKNRRRFLARSLWAAGACLSPYNAIASPVAIDHTAAVRPVDQGNADLCWLAASAMVQSYQLKKTVGMQDTASFLGEPFLALYKTKANLSGQLINSLASKLGLVAHGYQSFTIDWWAARLKKGPLWIGGQDPKAGMGHVRVMTAMAGDISTSAALKVTYIDPNGARKIEQPFRAFIAFYEELPRRYLNLVNQIFAFD
jgi:hypothetical protein